MRIGASFKVSAGEEAVIAALIVPTVADGAVEKHIIAATGALVKADINAACLPHPDQGTLSRYGDAAAIRADGHIMKPKIPYEGSQKSLPCIEKSLLAAVGTAFPLAADEAEIMTEQHGQAPHIALLRFH